MIRELSEMLSSGGLIYGRRFFLCGEITKMNSLLAFVNHRSEANSIFINAALDALR